MYLCSRSHTQRIRRSIFALVALFGLGLGVLTAAFTIFDSRLRLPDLPISMVEKAQKSDLDALPLFLVLIAGIGLPLGAYVVSTLAECERQAQDD